MSPLGRRPPRAADPHLAGRDTSASVPSWESIARSHGRLIYTIAYRLTNNHDDAQDLVQEVLVRVRHGLTTYRPVNLEGWLSRITTNAFLDETRRRRRRPTDPLDDDVERRLVGNPPADEAAAASGLSSELERALAELPPDFRVAVVLCDVVGMTYDEIAVAVGVPLGTVRSRIHRGRAQLR